jgi:hypothetical protein
MRVFPIFRCGTERGDGQKRIDRFPAENSSRHRKICRVGTTNRCAVDLENHVRSSGIVDLGKVRRRGVWSNAGIRGCRRSEHSGHAHVVHVGAAGAKAKRLNRRCRRLGLRAGVLRPCTGAAIRAAG